MAVDDQHTQYVKFLPQWNILRDVISGQEAIHSKKEKYLPKLSGQDTDEYNAYLTRALFYGATSRTLDGLSGMIFRKPPIIELPVGADDIKNDITLNGLSLHGFLEQIVDDIIAVGRCGILVDHPDTAELNITLADAQTNNIRPFLKHYKTESIINWKTSQINNATVLSEVRLTEVVEELSDEEFESTTVQQIRVLDLNEFGVYRQRIFRKNSKRNKWEQFGDDIFPLINGKYMTSIPFFFVGVKNGLPDVEKPPLIDLANANISHYKTTADLEHGAHFTALPTAVISGYIAEEAESEEYRIGSATAWVFSNPDTKVEYLEFKGQGLQSLENRLKVKEEYMAFLGARMLSPDKKAVETAETASIHRMGENSILASISQSISQTIETALKVLLEWAKITGDVKVELNRDFMPTIMSPQQLIALMQLWQSGGIAFEDLIDNLKRGEILDDDRTVEDIQSEIETTNPFKNEDLTNA